MTWESPVDVIPGEAGYSPKTTTSIVEDVLAPVTTAGPRYAFDTGGDDRPTMPSEVSRDTAGRWIIPLEAIGYGTAVRMNGHVAKRPFSLSVPPGLKPVAFIADAMTSPDVYSGFLEIAPGDQPARTVDLGESKERPKVVQVRVPLEGAQVVKDKISIEFISRLRSVDDTCSASLAGVWLDLRHPALILEGMPLQPTTVADFFPPLLKELNLYVPENPTEIETQTTMVLAEVATMLAGNRALSINVRKASADQTLPDVEPSPISRTVVIDNKHDAAVALRYKKSVEDNSATGAAMLVIGGGPVEMNKLSRGMAGSYRKMATATEFRVESIVEEPQNQKARRTFESLGLGGMEMSGVGQLELPIGVNQSMFSGPVKNVYIDVKGAFSIIGDGAVATLSLLVNNQIVSSMKLEDETGNFSLAFDLPPELITRDMSFVVRVDYTPPGGNCRPGVFPFTYQLMPTSYIDISRGQGMEAGFERYPQNLLPWFRVGFDKFTLDRVNIATQLAAALQRNSVVTLDPRVTTFANALDGLLDDKTKKERLITLEAAPTILIGASRPKDTNALETPLGPDPLRVFVGAEDERIRYSINNDFAVIEVDEVGGEDEKAPKYDRMLVTWRGSDDMPTGLLEGFYVPKQGWSMLKGDTYFKAGGTPALDLSLRRKAVLPSPTKNSKTIAQRVGPLLKLGLILTIVVLLGVFFRLVMVRRRRYQIERGLRDNPLADPRTGPPGTMSGPGGAHSPGHNPGGVHNPGGGHSPGNAAHGTGSSPSSQDEQPMVSRKPNFDLEPYLRPKPPKKLRFWRIRLKWKVKKAMALKVVQDTEDARRLAAEASAAANAANAAATAAANNAAVAAAQRMAASGIPFTPVPQDQATLPPPGPPLPGRQPPVRSPQSQSPSTQSPTPQSPQAPVPPLGWPQQ